MRFSQLFGRTLRDAPAEADTAAYALAVRAGLARPLEGGGLAYLPLGWRVMNRLTDLVRAALTGLGAQELRLPAGEAEAQAAQVAELARREVESYRQLPRLLLNFATGPGGGALGLGAREALTGMAYSLHLEQAALEDTFGKVAAAWVDLLARLELPAAVVDAAQGQAFVLTHPQGRDAVLRCAGCGYAALATAAVARPAAGVGGVAAPMEKVATPDCHTIAELARYLGIEARQTLKAVFYMRDEAEFVFAVIRGDLDVNETKLRHALGGGALRPATDAEIVAAGAAPGYASPTGLKVRASRAPKELQAGRAVTVVADASVEAGSNFAAGANEAGYHFINVNYPRDFASTLLVDIAQAEAGQACTRCAGTLQAERGVTLAHAEEIGTRLSVDGAGQPRVTALDTGGRPQPLWMGAYSIGIDRLLAAIIETHHDENGLRWPRLAAPFEAHLVSLLKGGDEAERLYADLQAAGLSVLLDDRADSPGVKFADADLLGCPLRLTVSSRSLKAGGVEWKRRDAAEAEVVALEAVAGRLEAVS